MKRSILAAIGMLCIGVAVGVVLASQGLSFPTRPCAKIHVANVKGAFQLYPEVPLTVISSGEWINPRARVCGVAINVRYNPGDGDTKFDLKALDGQEFIVGEIIPELHREPPKEGEAVCASGIVRYDEEHRWWELHPVTAVERSGPGGGTKHP